MNMTTPPDAHPLCIGYLHLRDLSAVLERSTPVYIAPLVESTTGSIPAQRTDHHFIMVTQPDTLNHVHYCRIPVVQLVYHHGIAFAPDYRAQLEKVGTVRREVERWLGGEGFQVWAGMVALPQGMILVDGAFQNSE